MTKEELENLKTYLESPNSRLKNGEFILKSISRVDEDLEEAIKIIKAHKIGLTIYDSSNWDRCVSVDYLKEILGERRLINFLKLVAKKRKRTLEKEFKEL